MPRFKFQWSNLSIELLRALAKELKLLGNNYTESLRSSYGARPKAEFVKDAWQVLLESWLSDDHNAQNNIAEALREKNLGDVTINDNYAYLKTCRNTSNMREVVLAEFIAFAERLAQSSEDSEEITMIGEEESAYVSADGKNGELSVEEKFVDDSEDSASNPDLDIEAGVRTCIEKAAKFIAEGIENPNHELYQLSGFTALRKDFDHLAVLSVAMELGLISIEGIILYSCLRAYCAKFLRKYLCMQHNNFMVDAGIEVSERTLTAIDQAQEYLTWHTDKIVQQQSDGALRNLQRQSSNDQSDFKKSFPEKCGEAIDMGMGALLEITNDFYAESENSNEDSTLSEFLESLVSMYNPLNLDDGYYINPDALDWDLHDIGKFCRIVLAKSESSESVDFKNVVSVQLQKEKSSSCDSANLKNADYLNDNSREKQPSGEAPLAATRTAKSLNETDRQMLQTWELFKPAEAIDLKFLVYDSEGRFGGEFTANDKHGDRYFIVKQDPTNTNWKMSSNLISLLSDSTSTLPKSARASLDEYREVLAKSIYRYEAGL